MWQKSKRWNAVTRSSTGAVDLPTLALDGAVWGMRFGDFPFSSKCQMIHFDQQVAEPLICKLLKKL